MDLTKKPIFNEAFATEAFENETLIYNEQQAQALYLNDSANAILQLCKEELTIDQIINCLREAYPEHQQTLEEDVISTIETLIAKGAVTLSDD
jgi:hypothetical protein